MSFSAKLGQVEMQFIEASMLGVRSARLTFVSTSSPIRITLFPMVHVGQAHFYEATYADAKTHDVLFLEGVRSPVTARITRSYRWLVGSRTMRNLVVQPRYPITQDSPRIVRADLSGEEFEAEWCRVPIWIRILIYLVAPILGLQRRWFYSRTKLAKDMSCEDQPDLAELLAITPESGALTQAILHARDHRLIELLSKELNSATLEAQSLAIIYGAAHMRAVVKELTNRRFIVRNAEWRTVISEG